MSSQDIHPYRHLLRNLISRKILGKEIKSSQYGRDYISEFRRVIETYVDKDAKHYLEWGTGYTTVVMAEIAARTGAKKLVTIDSHAKYMQEFVLPFAHESFLDARALSIDGPCVNDRDTGLNYTSYPLSLGIKFDFIFIDGRRRMECAFVSSLLSHDLTIIVIHDYRRLRYQPIWALFDLIEDGTQFRVMRRRRSLSAQIDERFQLVIGSMKPPLPTGSASAG